MRIGFFGETHGYNTSFLLGHLLTYDCSRNIIFGTSVWDSGFQRTHKRFFGEPQFDSIVCVSASAEI